jgi:hypothetical protein
MQITSSIAQTIVKIYLLQVKLMEAWQVPLHFLGGGPNPLSLKLSDSGQIPVSNTPIMMLLSIGLLRTFSGNPMKSHDLVVRSFFFLLGNTDTTPSIPTYISMINVTTFVVDIQNMGKEMRFTHQLFFELLA